MKRSEINRLIDAASTCFAAHHWHLPQNARWDVTDFGLGNVDDCGLVLVNLTTQPEYWEKLMYAQRGMVTPCHCHRRKKEDVVCRVGVLEVKLWADHPEKCEGHALSCVVNGESRQMISGQPLVLSPGERVTVPPFVYHQFVPLTPECIIGEVSTFNDDVNDNFFVDPRIGRYPTIEDDAPKRVRILSESAAG